MACEPLGGKMASLVLGQLQYLTKILALGLKMPAQIVLGKGRHLPCFHVFLWICTFCSECSADESFPGERNACGLLSFFSLSILTTA